MSNMIKFGEYAPINKAFVQTYEAGHWYDLEGQKIHYISISLIGSKITWKTDTEEETGKALHFLVKNL